MATTYIKHQATTHGNRLDNGVMQLRNGIEELRELYALMISMRDGTNFTLVEEQLGLTAGDGAIVFNLVKESLELIDALDGTAPNKLQKLITRVN